MKDLVKNVLVLLTAALGIGILVASIAIWFSTDAAALERYKVVVSTALMPALSALLTFLAATGILKGLITASDNAQRLAKSVPPERIELFT